VTRAITEFGADPVNFALTADQQELWSLADHGHLDDKLRRVVAEGVGLVRGVGVTSGAFAATPVPGQVDPMVVGTDPADMALAARRMLQLGGGIVVVRDGAVLAEVALPVIGLLDDGPLDDTIEACRAVARAVAEIGCPDPDVVSNAAFATLPRSLPRLKLTSHGLVRVFREGPREVVPFVIAPAGD
jgi:adenine deaminase